MEDVTMYASNNFGFFERNCDASVYLRCKADRRPPATDPIPWGDPRIRSLNADAYHSKHAKIGPSIVDCVAKFNGDDSVNICGDYHVIASATDWTTADKDNCHYCELRVLAKNNDGKGINIRIGDRAELTAYNGKRLQDAPVVLSKASQGVIARNTLTGNRGEAIRVAPGYWWLESGSSNEIEIRGNTIRNCRSYGIGVYSFGGDPRSSHAVAPAGPHYEIIVADNKLIRCPMPNVLVTSTDGYKVLNNEYQRPLENALADGPANVKRILDQK